MEYYNKKTQELKPYNELKLLLEAQNNIAPAEGVEIIADEWTIVRETVPPTFSQFTQTIAEGKPLFDGAQYNQT